LGQQPVNKPGSLFFPNRGRNHALRSESYVEAPHRIRSAKQHTGADEKADTRCDLKDDQRIP
jgi:hypothetical protein